MKNTISALAMMLLITPTLFAQKIDLDRVYYTYSYRSLPERPLPSKMLSYKVAVVSTMSDAINNSKVENVYIAGLTKDQANGAVAIKYKFDDIIIGKTTPIERIDIRKDRDGKETGRSYYYKMEVLYTLNAACMVVGNDGSSIFNNADSPKRSFYSPEYGTATDAQNFWFNNIASLKNKMVEDVMNEYITKTNLIINHQIGYPIETQNRILWITDSPKHPENNDFIKNTKVTADKLKSIGGGNSVAEIAKSLAEEIKYFEGIKNKYSSTEKPDTKLRYGAYYNLAMIYYAIDQPANAKQVAEALIANDYDKADGKIIIAEADRVIAAMAVNKMNTTHFDDSYITNH